MFMNVFKVKKWDAMGGCREMNRWEGEVVISFMIFDCFFFLLLKRD